MRNISYVGLCSAMILGLVAVALGQQPASSGQSTPWSAPQTINTTGQPVGQALPPARQENDSIQHVRSQAEWGRDQVRSMRPPEASERSLMTGRYQPAAPGMNDGQRRGELGVWMGESGGPGVRILRINSGSAAEKAGLRVGDVILQVNGRGATSPQDTAMLIRQIAIGESGTLMVWRDGNQQQIRVSVQPIREVAREIGSEGSHQVGFGQTNSADSSLATRTMRLEQQINSLTQELATLRQELAQLRTSGPVQTGFNADVNQSAPPQEPPVQSDVTTSPPPPPGFERSEEEPAKPAAEAAKPATPIPPAAPAAAKPPADDLFDSGAATPKSEPKPEEKPKAEEKGGTDDLFK